MCWMPTENLEPRQHTRRPEAVDPTHRHSGGVERATTKEWISDADSESRQDKKKEKK